MGNPLGQVLKNTYLGSLIALIIAIVVVLGYAHWWSEFDRIGNTPFTFLPGSEGNSPLFWLQVYQAFLILICVGIVCQRIFLRTKNKFPRKNHWAIYLFTLCFTLIWIPQGFDVTDEGTRLVHSWFLLKGHWSDYIGLKWGGHYLYGLWLHAFGEPNLLWARVAYALITAGITSLSVAIVELDLKGFKVFVLGCLASLVINIFAVQTVNYNNTPVILVLAFILLFLQGSRDRNNLKLLLSGALLSLTVLAKFPFIGILLIPFIYAGVEYVFSRNTEHFKSLIPASVGVFIGLTLGAALMYYHDVLWRYVEIIYQVIFKEFINEETGALIKHRHNRGYLAHRYTSDLTKVLHLSAIFLPTMLGVASLAGVKKWRFVTYIFGLIITYCVFDHFFFHYRWFHSIIAISICVFFLGSVFSFREEKRRSLIIWPFALLIFSFLGSNNGVLNMVMSGGISLFVIAGAILAFRRVEINSRITIDLRPAVVAACALMAVKGQELKQKITYRDSRKTELIVLLEHPAVWGIFTNADRANAVNELLASADKNIGAESRVAAVNYIPIFNYLLDGAPSKVTDSDFIIYSHTNSKDPKWPNTENAFTPYDSTGYFLALEEMNNGATDTLMINDCFVLTKRE